MHIAKRYFYGIIFLVAAQTSYSTEIVETFGHVQTIQSETLIETREILIHLPSAYSKQQAKYPVLYVLDGSRHFKHAVIAMQQLVEAGKMPQTIIVGISNNTGQRMRDSYDGRAQFLTFINKEVTPFITESYSTSAIKVFFGHSAMGLVSLVEFAKGGNAFSKFIASSPAIDTNEEEFFDDFAQKLKSKLPIETDVYFSVGEKNREGLGFVDGAEQLASILEKNATAKVNWHLQILNGHNHTSAAYAAMYNGLSFVFRDFEAPALPNYQAFNTFGGMDKLSEFFIKRGLKYRVESRIPIHTITGLAFAFYGEGKLEQAIELLEQQVANYQEPMFIYGALGFIYEHKQEHKKALQAYQDALRFAKKSNRDAQAQQYYQSKVAELEHG